MGTGGEYHEPRFRQSLRLGKKAQEAAPEGDEMQSCSREVLFDDSI